MSAYTEPHRRLRPFFSVAALLLAGLTASLVARGDGITVRASLAVVNGNFSLTQDPGIQSLTQANSGSSYVMQTIPNGTATVVTISGLTTNGLAWFRNWSTNTSYTVDLGGGVDANTNVVVLLRLKAGEAYPVRLHPTNAVYAVANGGAVTLQAWVNQD